MNPRRLLDRGLAVLAKAFGEPFTVDSLPGRTFTGMIEESVYDNQLDVGGFIPGQDAVLYVQSAQFTPVSLKPWPGMRLSVLGRAWIVSSVGFNAHRWRLTLTVAHPKERDVPGPGFILRSGGLAHPFLTDIPLEPDTALTWASTGFSELYAYNDRQSFVSWPAGQHGFLVVPEWITPIAGVVFESNGSNVPLAGIAQGYTEPAGALFCQTFDLEGDPDTMRVYRTSGTLAANTAVRIVPGVQ